MLFFLFVCFFFFLFVFCYFCFVFFFFFSSRRRHTRSLCDWSSDVCSSDLGAPKELRVGIVTLLSGPASSTFGIPAKKAADAWVEKINDEGGIGGAKLVRSEERRVGKEGRCRWEWERYKKNTEEQTRRARCG